MKLTEVHKQMLSDLLHESLRSYQFPDKASFMMRHKRQIEELEELERERLVREEQDKITLTLPGLLAIRSDSLAKEVLKDFSNLWPVLERAYESDPNVQHDAAELAGLQSLMQGGTGQSSAVAYAITLMRDLAGWWTDATSSNGLISALRLTQGVYKFNADNWIEKFEQQHAVLTAAVGHHIVTGPFAGQSLPPAPAPATARRQKHEKFGILDSPKHLDEDLRRPPGTFGTSLVYLDVDHFKEFNTKYLETRVDQTILPQFHRLIDDAAHGHGHAYAEGGDEVVVLLPNCSAEMAHGFAEGLRGVIASAEFRIDDAAEHLTVSVGVATATDASGVASLKVKANEAKRQAKNGGRNRTVAALGPGVLAVPGPTTPQYVQDARKTLKGIEFELKTENTVNPETMDGGRALARRVVDLLRKLNAEAEGRVQPTVLNVVAEMTRQAKELVAYEPSATRTRESFWEGLRDVLRRTAVFLEHSELK